MSDIRILDGLVTISDEQFTDVVIAHSQFRRWSRDEIAQYHKQLQAWERWGWTRKLLGRTRLTGWLLDKLGVPRSRPADRHREFRFSRIDGGDRALTFGRETP